MHKMTSRRYNDIRSSFRGGVSKVRLSQIYELSRYMVDKITGSKNYADFLGVSVKGEKELKALERKYWWRFETTKSDKYTTTFRMD